MLTSSHKHCHIMVLSLSKPKYWLMHTIPNLAYGNSSGLPFEYEVKNFPCTWAICNFLVTSFDFRLFCVCVVFCCCCLCKEFGFTYFFEHFKIHWEQITVCQYKNEEWILSHSLKVPINTEFLWFRGNKYDFKQTHNSLLTTYIFL